ncbi:CU044_2847 family protein [Streptomyces sp. NPDC058642]|uniref:CU044_2847 family protein n=1 Tax=Streptomyces sp. NPDC058642 TaxID=3346572 RepID=UPI0036475B38
MGQPILVRAGGTEFYAEVSDGGGPQPVGLGDALSFDGVRDMIAAVGGQLSAAWESAKPAEATVSFGVNLSTKTGKLSGLLVEGGGSASLEITLTWKYDTDGAAAS